MTELETQKANMRKLGLTEDEITELLAYDKAVDRSKGTERLEHDLPIEVEKEAKKLANCRDRKKPTTYDFSKRERKADNEKAELIKTLYDFIIANICDKAEIVNKEREIALTLGEGNFSLTLVRHRNK